jgi:hypothetical protein
MTIDSPQTKPSGDRRPEVDEFAHIPSRRRHPLFAIAGAALAFFLVFHIRHDIRFALSSGTPLDVGAARSSFGSGKDLGDLENRYVRVAGTPDRESALELDTKGSWEFTQFFRVLGTGDRLFVHRLASPLPAELAESDVFEGRLERVDDLSFADAIRAYFAQHVAATHFFAPDAFLRALDGRAGAGPLPLVDRAGDPVALGPEEQLVVEVSKPDQVVIGLPRTRFATEGEARAAIESRAGEVLTSRGLVKAAPPPGAPTAGPLSSAAPPPERWTFVARFAPARRQDALDALGDLDPLDVSRAAREAIPTRLADLQPAGGPAASGGLVVRAAGDAPERRVAPAEIAAVHTVAPVVIPADAFLLVEGDHPRQHLPSVLIALVLVVFGVVNIAGLLRDRAQARASR